MQVSATQCGPREVLRGGFWEGVLIREMDLMGNLKGKENKGWRKMYKSPEVTTKIELEKGKQDSGSDTPLVMNRPTMYGQWM